MEPIMPEQNTHKTATPSYLEAVQSQLPALQMLINMGWEYLTPEECVALRGGRLGDFDGRDEAVRVRNQCGGAYQL